MKAYKKLHKINFGRSGISQENIMKNSSKIRNFDKNQDFWENFLEFPDFSNSTD